MCRLSTCKAFKVYCSGKLISLVSKIKAEGTQKEETIITNILLKSLIWRYWSFHHQCGNTQSSLVLEHLESTNKVVLSSSYQNSAQNEPLMRQLLTQNLVRAIVV